jgi:hypothetical protein
MAAIGRSSYANSGWPGSNLTGMSQRQYLVPPVQTTATVLTHQADFEDERKMRVPGRAFFRA